MGAATDLVAARAQLLGDSGRLNAAAIREAMTDLNELWLTTKAAEVGITDSSGFAIVALGGLGRREMLPYSDLDLVLLHDENIAPETLSEVADGLWYHCGTPIFGWITVSARLPTPCMWPGRRCRRPGSPRRQAYRR